LTLLLSRQIIVTTAAKEELAMRRFLVFFVVTVAATLVVPLASATRPVKEFLPAEDVPLPDICPFTVQLDVLANKEYSKTFRNGRVLITGKLKIRLTNVESGKAIDANISGQGVFRFHEDGSLTLHAHGRWLFFFFPDELGPGAPGRMFLNSGRLVLNAGPGGTEITSRTGHMLNVCAALAS
jgi:hypothetical protein